MAPIAFIKIFLRLKAGVDGFLNVSIAKSCFLKFKFRLFTVSQLVEADPQLDECALMVVVLEPGLHCAKLRRQVSD